MKKVNLSKQKNIEKATQLANSRKESFSEKIRDNILHYESLQIEPIKLMHFILKQRPEKKILNFAIKNYIINLVSLWETFFRDLFVIVMKLDQEFKTHIIENYAKNEEYLEIDNIEEIIALAANFQNLDDLNEAFQYIFNNENILDVIGKYEQNIFMNPNIIKNFSIDKFCLNWKEEIIKTFDLRHKFIHDANFKYTFNRQEIQVIEMLFNIIPKTFTNIIADKYQLKKLIAHIEDNQVKYVYLGYGDFHYISSIEDILSDDWKIS